ncbi:hypothetical protein FRC02_008745 [Tulasnella sp. 418]|nr:hypothetical protein FRC02_008745 [Tulasnella sp. 418]
MQTSTGSGHLTRSQSSANASWQSPPSSASHWPQYSLSPLDHHHHSRWTTTDLSTSYSSITSHASTPAHMHSDHRFLDSQNSLKRKVIEYDELGRAIDHDESRPRSPNRKRLRSSDSLPYSDEDPGPSTPVMDDTMEWEGADQAQMNRASPSHTITLSPASSRFAVELTREAKPPRVATTASSFTTGKDSRDLPPSQTIPLLVDISPRQYTLSVSLPGYSSEEMTVSCRGENVIHIVADRWILQRACRHEWTVTFDDDVRLDNVKATIDNGTLRLGITRYRTSVPITYQVERASLYSSRYL